MTRGGRIRRPALGLPLLVGLVGLTYLVALDRAPVFVSNDEAHFSSHALSIATTGRDLNGVRFPFFVQMIDPLVPDNISRAWWQPFLFYGMALSLKIFPFTEWSIRLPTALIGLLNIGLTFAVTRETFPSRTSGWRAALLLATTPAHFIMTRQALDYICPVPFALGWLWCLGRFLRSGRRGYLIAAGAVLGAGIFSHIAAWAVMPLLAGITIATLWSGGALRPAMVLAFGIGLTSPLLAVVPWLWLHPDVFAQILGRYGVNPAEHFTGIKRLGALAKADVFQPVSMYWGYYNPSFLLFGGGSSPTQTTSHAGVFLLPCGALLATGVYRICAFPRQPLSLAILWGFLIAPLPAVIVKSSPGIVYAIMLVPFGVLIAAHGIEWLSTHGRGGRIAVATLVVLLTIQFVPFLDDYFTDYQLRAAPRFDALNTRDVAEFVIAHDAAAAPIPVVFLSDDLDSKAVRWRFHLWKAARPDLWAKTRYFSAAALDGDGVPPGSLLVFFSNDPWIARLLSTGGYSTASTISQPAGDPSAVILRRER